MTITEQDIERAREWWETNFPGRTPHIAYWFSAIAEYAAATAADKDVEIARLQELVAELKAVAEAARSARDIVRAEISQPGDNEHRYRALKSVAAKLDAALDGEKSDG